jgi:hypothetical protein
MELDPSKIKRIRVISGSTACEFPEYVAHKNITKTDNLVKINFII